MMKPELAQKLVNSIANYYLGNNEKMDEFAEAAWTKGLKKMRYNTAKAAIEEMFLVISPDDTWGKMPDFKQLRSLADNKDDTEKRPYCPCCGGSGWIIFPNYAKYPDGRDGAWDCECMIRVYGRAIRTKDYRDYKLDICDNSNCQGMGERIEVRPGDGPKFKAMLSKCIKRPVVTEKRTLNTMNMNHVAEAIADEKGMPGLDRIG